MPMSTFAAGVVFWSGDATGDQVRRTKISLFSEDLSFLYLLPPIIFNASTNHFQCWRKHD
ncbi:hypothetical protein MTR_5g025300 [Medicago truncatula]|uniref:Uncharacterized protein n=1 Tax=Medicago truncatula TaxID=3880 RepID=G7K3Z0_MEDTR|nr:hypothetical protein MTR_5g025300 [Medicago truncatula]